MNKFTEAVQKEMDRIIAGHAHADKRYAPTTITSQVVNADELMAAFVLREQIDIDTGGFGNQYRHSVWYITPSSEAKQIYEDHEYERIRDSFIGLAEVLDDGVVASVSLKDGRGRTGNRINGKITLDGKLEDPKGFMDKAQNLITRIGPKHGYDGITSILKVGEENIAVIVWAAGNGKDNECDHVYLVWEDKDRTMNYQEVTSSSDYLHPKILRTPKLLSIEINKTTYKFSSADLKM